MLRLSVALLPLSLAACGGVGGNITINDKDGNVAIATDKDGRTTIKAPGVDITTTLPKVSLKAEDFDINGMKLYPGSTISDVNIQAGDNGNANDHVALKFAAPADLASVQAWFRDQTGKHGFKVTPSGNGFAGTTDDGQPITIELNADGKGKTSGALRVGA